MNLILTLTSILIIGLSLLPAQAYAMSNTYYVTPTGNASDPDCSGGGAPSCAGAYDADDFNGLRGDYSDDTFFFTGTFSTRIQVLFVEGTPGHPVTLDGYYAGDCDPINALCSSSAILSQGMAIGGNKEGPDHINVYDFRMTRTNSTNPGFRIYGDLSEGDDEKHCDYLNIKRNYVYETYGTMFFYYSGRYSTVENNKFTHFGQNGTDTTQGINLIQVDDFIFRENIAGHDDSSYPSGCQSAEMIELHGCHRVLIERNDIYGAPNQSGIRPKEGHGGNTDLIIRFNKIHDHNSRKSGGEQAGKGIHIHSDSGNNISEVYIYGNFIFNNWHAGISVWRYVNNVHIWSNLIINNGRYGFKEMPDEGTGSSGFFVYNNTFARNGYKDKNEKKRGGIVIQAGNNVNVINNIFWNNRPGGEGSKFNQIYTSVNLSSLEHNTYYHSSTTPNFYYNRGFKSLNAMQKTYSKEDDSPGGEIADPGFIDPAGPDNTYGTADDDYRLDGPYLNTGADLAQCFNVSVQGKNYHMCYGDALDPTATNWSTTPPTVRTTKQDDHDSWERGAYVYKGNTQPNIDPLPSPHSLRILN